MPVPAQTTAQELRSMLDDGSIDEGEALSFLAARIVRKADAGGAPSAQSLGLFAELLDEPAKPAGNVAYNAWKERLITLARPMAPKTAKPSTAAPAKGKARGRKAAPAKAAPAKTAKPSTRKTAKGGDDADIKVLLAQLLSKLA